MHVTRDHPLPFKPDPAAARFICKDKWNLTDEKTKQVMFVGDFRDDLICGR